MSANHRIEGQTGAMKRLRLLHRDSLDGAAPHTQLLYWSANMKEFVMALRRVSHEYSLASVSN